MNLDHDVCVELQKHVSIMAKECKTLYLNANLQKCNSAC